jgi:hypothetical protein
MPFDRKAWQKAYRSTEKYKAKRREKRALQKDKERQKCKEYYQRHKEDRLAYNAWLRQTPEYSQYLKDWKQRDYEVNGVEKGRKKVQNVELRYARELLNKDGKLTGVNVPKELLEAKRLQILIRREVNEKRK